VFLRLSEHFIPKILENYYFLNKKTDDLYEVDKDAFDLLISLKDGKPPELVQAKKTFINKLIRLGFIGFSEKKIQRKLKLVPAPVPSLRYLEVQLTSKCNLTCRHCYQGVKKDYELPFDMLKKILDEFVELQGIRLLLSGGEPLLYSKFGELNKFLKNYPAYVVLLTNGTLINEKNLSKLTYIDEIQFSIDGLEESHDYLRGTGSFARMIKAVNIIKAKTDKAVSFATMVHKKNLRDFPKLSRIIKSFGAREWGMDYPVFTGFFKNNKELYPTPEEALKAMKYKFGTSYHSTNENNDLACGAHLMTLLPDGTFVPCGFYLDRIFGHINTGLKNAVNNRHIYKLSDILDCMDCEYLYNCRGGCRFRAGSTEKKDEFMCYIYGRKI